MPRYIFTIKLTGIGKGYVDADSLEEAEEKINNHEWDDIFDTVDDEYNGIIDIWEAV